MGLVRKHFAKQSLVDKVGRVSRQRHPKELAAIWVFFRTRTSSRSVNQQ